MEPLNKKARSSAFINFLIFFSVTIALIVGAVLFSVEVPFKQNEQLRQQMTLVDKEREFSEKFITIMGETINLLDSVNKNDVQLPEEIEARIKRNEANMREMFENDSISQKNLYMYIVNTFAELRIAKKDLRNVSGKDASLTELQKQNAELRDNYNQLYDRYTQLQKVNSLQ